MTQTAWPEVLAALIDGSDLSTAQSTWAMEQILGGEATPSQIAGFAVALRSKGATVDEITAFVETMYRHAAELDVEGRVVDIVGTGGDGARTVNISTMSAVAIAGAGIRVVKHGNRASSSQSGSADVLESLGVRLDVPVSDRGHVLDEVQKVMPTSSATCSTRWASPFASRRRSIRQCASPVRPARNWACRRSSTSSARWPTRPVPPPWRSACPT
jgi:anthranilate phosphoribosyltransferase